MWHSQHLSPLFGVQREISHPDSRRHLFSSTAGRGNQTSAATSTACADRSRGWRVLKSIDVLIEIVRVKVRRCDHRRLRAFEFVRFFNSGETALSSLHKRSRCINQRQQLSCFLLLWAAVLMSSRPSQHVPTPRTRAGEY